LYRWRPCRLLRRNIQLQAGSFAERDAKYTALLVLSGPPVIEDLGATSGRRSRQGRQRYETADVVLLFFWDTEDLDLDAALARAI